jgi:site-specific DNA-methyltransferase (adenine-specific)
VLDAFAGSGSTGKACALESLQFTGIELDENYCKIAEARIIRGRGDVPGLVSFS